MSGAALVGVLAALQAKFDLLSVSAAEAVRFSQAAPCNQQGRRH